MFWDVHALRSFTFAIALLTFAPFSPTGWQLTVKIAELLQALYGSCERHLEIREQTCDYIQSHVAQFLDFVSNDFDE